MPKILNFEGGYSVPSRKAGIELKGRHAQHVQGRSHAGGRRPGQCRAWHGPSWGNPRRIPPWQCSCRLLSPPARTQKRLLYLQPIGPNSLTHRDESSRPALHHGSLNSLFQVPATTCSLIFHLPPSLCFHQLSRRDQIEQFQVGYMLLWNPRVPEGGSQVCIWSIWPVCEGWCSVTRPFRA